MSKHTPGPWNIAAPKEGGSLDQKEDRLICTKINNRLYHIAETFQYRNTGFNTPDGVSLANARLIAAAPDLLEALQLLWAEVEVANDEDLTPRLNLDEITQIQEAIAKATGD